MVNYKETTLWKSSLGLENELCVSLRVAFDSFRDRAEMLANEILRDQPSLTVHDITHIDSLWRMGSLIAGEGFNMTPPEGFVLGGAFLVHDIAMSLSAFPKGIDEFKNLPEWNDTIFSLLKEESGYDYSEIDESKINPQVQEQAKRILLRNLHAIKANKLCKESWYINENPYFLIDNPELRETYGNAIGEIAASHWWSTEDIKKKLNNSLGASAKFPSSWTVNKLKLAALLRLTDYCQIDETRAPSFLMGLRKPQGVSLIHWHFQNKLLQPILERNKLVYTSKSPFNKKESNAWWLCYDALKSIDTEIRNTNTMIKETFSDFVFQVDGILNIESPERLSEKIQTEKWLPIDATIQVTNVAYLAKSLGGRRLYGDDKTIPIRELLQNASDAIRARRLFEGKGNEWGEIVVREGRDGTNYWIEIEDNGVGMSKEVIKGPFLDFGTSYWGSNLMMSEFPGLISKGFSATGQYGIGFFSVFMICDKVEVKTLRAGRSRAETLILEFGNGLDARPVLRLAEDIEVLDDGGTKIKIWLKPNVVKEDGSFEFGRYDRPMKLERLVEWLCPSLDVNISCHDGKKLKRIIKANDWLKISGEKLLKRITRDSDRYDKHSSGKKLKLELDNLRLLKQNNKVVGRACFLNERPENRKIPEEGIVTVGGFRTNQLRYYDEYSFFGILLGKSNSAVRNSGIPIVNNTTLANWATEQGELWSTEAKDGRHYFDSIASIICQFGGNPKSQKFGTCSKGKFSVDSIKSWKSFPNEILIVDEDYTFRQESKKLILKKNVLVFQKSRFRENFFEIDDFGNGVNWPTFPKVRLTSKIEIPENSTYYWVLKAIAEKWNVQISEVIKMSDFSEKNHTVAMNGTKSVTLKADLIKNPKAK